MTRRRGWDSNPRRLAPHTLSKRADSAALAPLLGNRQGIGQLRPGTLSTSHPLGEVTVGPYATSARESGQDRKVAAFTGTACVP